MLAARLIWEMTALTWSEGPQMVGFSLMHGFGAFLVLFPLALLVWIVVFAILAIVHKIRRRVVGTPAWSALACAVAAIGLLSLPQSFFNRIFVARLASSARAEDFLVSAAADGETAVVKALLARGVPIQSVDNRGSSALHAAACAGKPEVVRYLIAAGADVNALNLYGDSPLSCPTEKHNAPIVQLLEAAGGKLVQGTEEQRQRASEQIVRRDMEVDKKRK